MADVVVRGRVGRDLVLRTPPCPSPPEGAIVVVDGAPEDDATRDAVLARADVVRADATEARLLTGRDLSGVDDARDVAAELLTAGARVVALGVGEEGDLVAWRAGPRFGVAAEELEVDPGWADGDVLVPPLGEQPVDPTGAGTPTSPRSSRPCWAALPRRTPPGPRRRPPG